MILKPPQHPAALVDQLSELGKDDVSVFMSPVNLTEVYYDRIKVAGLEKAKQIYEWIKTAIIIPEVITDIINLEAGRLKSLYKISLGDSYGLSTALALGGTFVTADHHELEEVERNEAIPFLWIRWICSFYESSTLLALYLFPGN